MYKSKLVHDIEKQIYAAIERLNQDRFAPLNIDRRRKHVMAITKDLLSNLYAITPALEGMIDWIYRDLILPKMWGSVKSIPYFKQALQHNTNHPGAALDLAERRAIKDKGLSRVWSFIRLEDYAISEIDAVAENTRKVVDRPVLLAGAGGGKHVVVWLHALAHFCYATDAPTVRIKTARG